MTWNIRIKYYSSPDGFGKMAKSKTTPPTVGFVPVSGDMFEMIRLSLINEVFQTVCSRAMGERHNAPIVSIDEIRQRNDKFKLTSHQLALELYGKTMTVATSWTAPSLHQNGLVTDALFPKYGYLALESLPSGEVKVAITRSVIQDPSFHADHKYLMSYDIEVKGEYFRVKEYM